MHRRQTLPRLWMMTDERQGEYLWRGLATLPRGAGVIFRHYGLPAGERKALFKKVRAVARRRNLVLLLAGSPSEAAASGADGSHGRGPRGDSRQLRSAPAHNVAEIRRAERQRADLVFVSPVFATRSHPDAKALGPLRFAALTRCTHLPVIALGGMSPVRAKRLGGARAYGWAAIDAWSR